MNVKLSNYGSSLSSRLQGREVFSLIKSDVMCANTIVLDFEGVDIMTFSFGTELFDSINESYCGHLEVINANDFLKNIIKFCRNNVKEMAI